MFGAFIMNNNNDLVEKVEYQIQSDAHFRSANKDQKIIIDTPLGRVYLNADSYLMNVPQSVWDVELEVGLSPKLFLEEKIGNKITDQEIEVFQKLLNDLIDAEFKSKDDSK